MKHGQVRRVVRVGPINAAGDHHTHRRPLLLEHADLHRAGLRTQQHQRILLTRRDEIEVVQRIAGRVLARNVERNEIVEFVLDFRTRRRR